MMKYLTAFGGSIWNVALALLATAAFVLFWGFIAFGIYSVVQGLGFSDKAASWWRLSSVGWECCSTGVSHGRG
jgi:hypothetical protein